MALTSGTKLAPYEIVSPLGAGGMGEVYRARDSRLGRDVALKILPDSLSRNTDRLSRFAQEARAVAALNHPDILAVFDIGAFNGSPFWSQSYWKAKPCALHSTGALCRSARRSSMAFRSHKG
ncbi:MAG: hypothetical protein NVS9B5_03310 [Terriglobales bacterium]